MTKVRYRRGGNEEPETTENHIEDYKCRRKLLSQMIIRAKRAHWRSVQDALEDDIWGQGYQIVNREAKGLDTPYELPHETKVEIMRQLFPRVEDIWQQTDVEMMPTPFTQEEVLAASEGLKNEKCPGPGGIRAETLKAMAGLDPGTLATLFSDLINREVFPDEWKVETRANLEGERVSKCPKLAETICILDALGKLYEALIRARLMEVESGYGLSDRQFGFRKGRSTIQTAELIQKTVDDARARGRRFCAMATIDVRNAFNSAKWSIILGELKTRGVSSYLRKVVGDYFTNRVVG